MTNYNKILTNPETPSNDETVLLLKKVVQSFDLPILEKWAGVVIKKRQEKEVKDAANKGYFGGWFGGAAQDEETAAEGDEFKMTKEEMEELHKTLVKEFGVKDEETKIMESEELKKKV